MHKNYYSLFVLIVAQMDFIRVTYLMSYGIIILAAGNGSRMQSSTPKVLHKLAGKPMLCHLVTTGLSLSNIKQVIVVGGANINQLQAALPQEKIVWAHQTKQLGTADAVAIGLTVLNPEIKNVLVLPGDAPLVSTKTLTKLITNTTPNTIGILTSNVEVPTGYGRIIRDGHKNFLKIVEELDANDTEKQITEVNTGIYLFPKDLLTKFLSKINNNNIKQEYYLTDFFKIAIDNGIAIHSALATHPWEIKGVNNIVQLVELEREFQLQQAIDFLEKGVIILDPKRFDVRGDVEIANDVEIDINVILVGKVIVERGVKIGANCYIKDSTIGANTIIEPNSMIDGAYINKNAVIGPFARLRPGVNIGLKSKIGNFVEIKATVVGENSKINHLSYVGDAKIGNNVNIGAGTITCNYDGVNKHTTIIEDDVLVGSDCQLIAPIKINKQATIAAGTTLINDAPANKLTLNKKDQQSREWQRPPLKGL